MGIIDFVKRAWATYKLSKGQCAWCQKPLRDDEKTSFCSDHCAAERQYANAV
jgi:hypothetical protein